MDEKITIADIKEIIDLVRADNKIEWFVFKQGDTEISVSRNGIPHAGAASPVQAVPAAPNEPAPQPAPAAVPAAASAPSGAAPLAPGDVAIKAPLVGTFYRSPKPGAPPFVEEGGTVGKGDTLCIVEVMKLMNSVKAEITGTIKQILVEDGEPVEFGQVLMIIGATE